MTEKYITENIIVGNGEIPAIRNKQGLHWVLPGGIITTSRVTALAYAERLNDIISANLLPFKRKLFRPT